MKKVLGLDLGTNSIGWALVERDFEEPTDEVLGKGKIIGMGSRIIPMSQDVLDKFGQGQSHSQTADRTGFRGVRRLRQRFLLRRERLHRVLNLLNALPKHYQQQIDFTHKKGKFLDDVEVKLNYMQTEEGKHEFIFMDAFGEMAKEFAANGYESNIPFDWTIYYLRKKALHEKITLEELAWLLLNFNQKRGYYQLRGEDEEIDKTTRVEFCAQKVVNVTNEEPNFKKEIWYNVTLENGWVYRRKSTISLDDWIGKTKEFIVTTQLNDDGSIKTDKEGNEKRSFKSVISEHDWIAIKKSTEEKIEKSKKSVGTYIYDTLLQNPTQKINGSLVKTIERKFYKDELNAILDKQIELNPKLRDNEIYTKCVEELYPNNEARREILQGKGFRFLLAEDIIFFQRPLKSKRSLVDGCKYESRTFIDKEGNRQTQAVKVIPKSHPLFQEFRVWQFADNIRIYEKEKLINGKYYTDYDVTAEYLPEIQDRVDLFDYFNDRASIKQSQFLALYRDENGKKLDGKRFRWNYVQHTDEANKKEKEYPLNETRALMITRFSKHKDFDWQSFLTRENEIWLWHILYSITDKKELEKALAKEDFKMALPADVRQEFINTPPFKKDYGALSEKAIKKLLPLMRMGKYWDYDAIDKGTKDRISKIINGEVDETIRERVRDKAIKLTKEEDFGGLPLWLASYIVYDRHSESGDILHWKNPNDIEIFLKEFKQHSLRNPIVEQVITETLRIVRDIWNHYGNGQENFFDEIHIELGREMKNTADERKRLTNNISKNQDTNQRIRTLLIEFVNLNIEGVIPHSPMQQEKLKIFEEDILNAATDLPDDIDKISKSKEPTAKEVEKYRLWMEQKYRSPYTGQVIPLSKLFTTEYEIEHIIPQARYFDDSLSNKIICETEVNRFKDKQTAYEMILRSPGQIINLGQGKNVRLFTVEAFQEFVSGNFKTGSKKHKILLSEDIPEQFIARQLNDTRYISKVVKTLLSNIVREKEEQEAIAKNVVPVTGGITSILKQDWGLNDKWNEIIEPRFRRMNELTNSNDFGYFDTDKNFFRISVPSELKRNFSAKRIDHRHHALDALIIACATRNHVGYLNNEHAKSEKKRYDLRNKLRRLETFQRNGKEYSAAKEFYKPWDNFTVEAKNSLENIVISFKQNLRVINKTHNKTWQWVDEHGSLKKTLVKQTKGDNWAIRKPMHAATVSGAVKIRKVKTVSFASGLKEWENLLDKDLKKQIKTLYAQGMDEKKVSTFFKKEPYQKNGQPVAKVDVYYFTENATATRTPLTDKFTRKQLESITDSGIRKILENHIMNFTDENGKEDFELAFSQEGIDVLNANIAELNGGKPHQPIYKVRIYEEGSKFNVGVKGNKRHKFVEAAKGTNLFFAIYKGKNKKEEEVRVYDTVPLNIVIERLKNGDNPVPEKYTDKDGCEYTLLFSLSPNDLVYVPSDEEIFDKQDIQLRLKGKDFVKQVYVFTDSSGTTANFIPAYSANLIFNMNFENQKKKGLNFPIQNEYGVGSPQSKNQKSLEGVMIKEICQKLKVNRIGRVLSVQS
jgi:CRISPR-associated endonuclease Csn1